MSEILSFRELAQLSVEELRRRLRDGDVKSRTIAAWALAANLAGAASVEPNVERRRLFGMNLAIAQEREILAVLAEHDPDQLVRLNGCQYLARLAAPGDAGHCDLLLRLSTDDADAEIRAAIIRNIPADCVEGRALPKEWLRDASDDVQNAAIDALLRWSETPKLFLQWVRDESTGRVSHALALLREQDRPLSWSDVPDSFLQRHPPVLAELAMLFAERDDAPVSLWLACAQHCETIDREQRAAVGAIADALARYAARTPALTEVEIEAARNSLAAVESVLPIADHWSYMELKLAGLIPDPRGKTVELEHPFSRLWTALVRLTPNYDPANCQMKPRYR